MLYNTLKILKNKSKKHRKVIFNCERFESGIRELENHAEILESPTSNFERKAVPLLS